MNSTFFHYKHNLFDEKLNWSNFEIKNFIYYLSKNREYIVFSSELNNEEKDNNLDTKKKRVSYRAKANDFKKKKNITKNESTNNKSKSQTDNLKQIKVLPENDDKKIEKRQGWWNQ